MVKPILGTMRLLEHHADADAWAAFFIGAWDAGLRSLHCSHEYESFDLLCAVLAILRRARPDVAFRHVVKLADPHFGEGGFDADRFIERLQFYRTRLATETVHDVQWMWRADLEDDSLRQSKFERSAPAIEAAVKRCKAERLLERFLCFPYTPAFAAIAVAQPAIDGLVVYRNRDELDYDETIDQAHTLGKSNLVIRPFAGGALLREAASDAALDYAFAVGRPGIKGAIVSMSKLSQVEALLAVAAA